MRVLVCGSRHLANWPMVQRELDKFHSKLAPITVLIHGAATGADSLAARWAKERGVPALAFSADWKALGRAAGPIRNRRMIEEGLPGFVVAFNGGTGTLNMIAQAKAAGIQILSYQGCV